MTPAGLAMRSLGRFHRLTLVAAATAAGALFGGCVLFRPYVSDLRFVDIAPTNAPQAKDMPTLKLRFSTKRYLPELGYGSTYVNVGLCPFVSEPLVATSRARYRGRDLMDHPKKTEEAQDRQAETILEYDAILYEVSLPAEPVDLCFTIDSPSYFGMGGFSSNAAVIPKDTLASALAALREATP